MADNFLKKIIQKNVLKPILVLVLIIIVAAGFLVSQASLYSTLFSALDPINSMEDAQNLYDEGKAYVSLENADVYFLDYGVYTYTTRNGIKTSDEKLSEVYGLVDYEDGYLLVQMPAEYLDMPEEDLYSVTAVSKLEALDANEFHGEAYDQLLSEVAEAFQVTEDDVREFAPEFCVTIKDRAGDQGIFVAAVIAILVSLGILIGKLLAYSNYKSTKDYKALNAIGDPEDIETKINNIVEREAYIYAGGAKSFGNAGLISDEYIVANKGSKLNVGKTSDLIWAYLKVTKHKTYFITVSKSYQLQLYFRGDKEGSHISIKNESEANRVIGEIAAKFPVICSFSEELARLYRKNNAEFQQLADKYKADFYSRPKQEEQQA